ncbi:hypothetical protein C2869_00480 [Saccharobesus litoralis]|uniref:Uncharacterized protein n=1 Tax=Saccharobesus litoralis TaxID=2172099 RepID=A0A2S0VLD1_9ALTE|nr:hypothetical protein C2869_00480 [Saccharobesus litoralis]
MFIGLLIIGFSAVDACLIVKSNKIILLTVETNIVCQRYMRLHVNPFYCNNLQQPIKNSKN